MATLRILGHNLSEIKGFDVNMRSWASAKKSKNNIILMLNQPSFAPVFKLLPWNPFFAQSSWTKQMLTKSCKNQKQANAEIYFTWN
jgi:hypothetical protein